MSSTTRTGMRMGPVRVLKMQGAALDAAMRVAVAGAEVGAVHKLRTATRRVEAQMLLLDALERAARPLLLPLHKREADAVRKRLRKVRRAAGEVRDLDVQIGAICADTPVKTDVQEGTHGAGIRDEAKQLRKHLERQRRREATGLRKTLREENVKLAASVHALVRVLEPAERRVISVGILVACTEQGFADATRGVLHVGVRVGESPEGALQRAVQGLAEEDLHTLRKAAKLCRYMAESAAEGSPAHAIAERFEAMQEAGGTWHDWLLLERLSAEFHGEAAALTERYRKHRDAALEEYRLKLVELLPVIGD